MAKSIQDSERLFEGWFESLRFHKSNQGPAKGTLAAALVVLERLKSSFDLQIESHTAEGGTQVSGVTGAAVQKILSRFGESRPFLAEGGRTNRGSRDEIKKMLAVLNSSSISMQDAKEQERLLDSFQQFVVRKIQEMQNRGGLRLSFSRTDTSWSIVHRLLSIAKSSEKGGPVAEYLVGAKLALRFPEIEIRNSSFTTADEQTGEPGDFFVGDTAIHVTIAPNAGHYLKCKQNLGKGMRVLLLVPDDMLEKERKNAKAEVPNQIAVESIESFVSQNLEELSEFTNTKRLAGLRRLISIYNERVRAVEHDSTCIIELPEEFD